MDRVAVIHNPSPHELNWENSESYLFLNPRFSADTKKEILLAFEQHKGLPGHVYLATSGTTGGVKMIGLSKEGLLHSARSVNQFLKIGSEDVWLQILPRYHVGGLAVEARTHAAGCGRVAPGSIKWDCDEFLSIIDTSRITVVSMVPTQLFDILKKGVRAPSHLRHCILGGGNLSPEIYSKAKDLGWPVILTYGMTECGSMIGVGCLEDMRWWFEPLPHVSVRTNNSNQLILKSKSVANEIVYIEKSKHRFSTIESWFESPDFIEMRDKKFSFVGREDEQVKISGELVSIVRLQERLEAILLQNKLSVQAHLFAEPDDRLGFRVSMVVSDGLFERRDKWIKEFQGAVLPFERVHSVYWISDWPVNELGKILRSELRKRIGWD